MRVGQSWILHERAQQHYWKGKAQLSIKTFCGGRAQYRVGCGYHAVDDSSYLVLNEGQEYEIEINSRHGVESFCLFLAPGLADEVKQSLAARPERLLDELGCEDAGPVRFFEKNYAHDAVLSPALRRLRKTFATQERGLLAEEIYGIVERLLRVHELVSQETERLSSVRAGTREELFRRVCRAHDYASAMFERRVTLEDLARVSCLSPNHLLRTFRQVFGQTPHQFLVERRLDEAKRLLRDKEIPVTEVCLKVGFESPGSFSALFRKRFGTSPSEWRGRKR